MHITLWLTVKHKWTLLYCMDTFRIILTKRNQLLHLMKFGKQKEKRHSEVSSEATRKIPPGWTEDSTTTCQIPHHMECGKAGNAPQKSQPSTAVKAAIASQQNTPLVNLFLFFFSLPLLEKIANATNFYATEEWVESVTKTDVNGMQSSHNYFCTCNIATPGATHQSSTEKIWKM